jgi:Arc/MetJ family transcription regulator
LVSKRLVDIDDDILSTATTVLGAKTMKEAVNRALESVVIADRRRRHAARLVSKKGIDLDDVKVMAGAWR